MKKILLVLLFIIIVVTFSGCQKIGENGNNEESSRIEESKKTPKKMYVPPNGIETRKEP